MREFGKPIGMKKNAILGKRRSETIRQDLQTLNIREWKQR